MLQRHRNGLQTFVQMVDGLTTMFFIYYCLYITKYW